KRKMHLLGDLDTMKGRARVGFHLGGRDQSEINGDAKSSLQILALAVKRTDKGQSSVSPNSIGEKRVLRDFKPGHVGDLTLSSRQPKWSRVIVTVGPKQLSPRHTCGLNKASCVFQQRDGNPPLIERYIVRSTNDRLNFSLVLVIPVDVLQEPKLTLDLFTLRGNLQILGGGCPNKSVLVRQRFVESRPYMRSPNEGMLHVCRCLFAADITNGINPVPLPLLAPPTWHRLRISRHLPANSQVSQAPRLIIRQLVDSGGDHNACQLWCSLRGLSVELAVTHMNRRERWRLPRFTVCIG